MNRLWLQVLFACEWAVHFHQGSKLTTPSLVKVCWGVWLDKSCWMNQLPYASQLKRLANTCWMHNTLGRWQFSYAPLCRITKVWLLSNKIYKVTFISWWHMDGRLAMVEGWGGEGRREGTAWWWGKREGDMHFTVDASFNITLFSIYT